MHTVPGTPARLRKINDRTALSLLLDNGAMTRNDLCRLSGLSRPTASQIMARLQKAGLVHVVGEVRANRGPRAANYSARRDHTLGVVVNLDHGLAQSTVVDAFNSDRPVVDVALSRSARDRDPVTDINTAIRAACEACDVDTDAVRFTCIGVQGSVNSRTDQLSFVEALPGWPRRDVHALLASELGHRVVIDNDVNLAAVAERRQGAGVGAGSFALVWIGEGLGLAVDFDGSLLRGASGRAGEIGYLPVPQRVAELDSDAGDLQNFIGFGGLLRLARSYGLRNRQMHTLLAAIDESPDREAIFNDLALRIAAAVTPVLAVTDPERVVLGGPIGTAGGAQLAIAVRRAIRKGSRWSPETVTSEVTDHPVLHGARQLLTSEVRNALLSEVS